MNIRVSDNLAVVAVSDYCVTVKVINVYMYIYIPSNQKRESVFDSWAWNGNHQPVSLRASIEKLFEVIVWSLPHNSCIRTAIFYLQILIGRQPFKRMRHCIQEAKMIQRLLLSKMQGPVYFDRVPPLLGHQKSIDMYG
jgi:hypothetical protein